MIFKFGNEFNILLKVKKEEFYKEKINEKLIEIILLNRAGKLEIKPGYDGKYGEIILQQNQAKLF